MLLNTGESFQAIICTGRYDN